MKGMAVITPIWKLVAPRMSAKAAKKPPEARPSAPDADTACRVILRRPACRSSSVSWGNGWNNLKIRMIDKILMF